MTLPLPINIASFFVASAIAAWFWPHCARPALRSVGAPRLAIQAALVLTIAMIIAQLVRAASLALAIQRPATFWLSIIVGVVYLVVVGFGFPRYRLLLRATEAFSGR
jgi:uncharacterized membrane protein